MASGTRREVRGSFKGTGAQLDVKTPQFRPAKVMLYNVDGNCDAVWTESMADGTMRKVNDSGSGTTDLQFAATNGITPLADGFRLGADADMNVSGELVHFIASE